MYGFASSLQYGLHSGIALATNNAPSAKTSSNEEYAWEKAYERTWESVIEDEEGFLQVDSISRRRDEKAVRNASSSNAISSVLGLLRHVFIILDVSKAMLASDYKPTRAEAVRVAVKDFIKEFFDENPISSLGIIVTKDSQAVQISEMSFNPKRHLDNIDEFFNPLSSNSSQKGPSILSSTPSGEMTIQGSIEMALKILSFIPSYGTREIIFIHGAHSTCDVGNIYDTILWLKKSNVQVSVCSLPGEVYIASLIAKETRGKYFVPENYDALYKFLLLLCKPLPKSSYQNEIEGAFKMFHVGFPQLLMNDPGLCVCHNQLRDRAYVCPRCNSRQCEIPNACSICSLQLIAAPQLARSYHHLFPVPMYYELLGSNAEITIAPISRISVQNQGTDGDRENEKTEQAMETISDSSTSCTGCTNPLLSNQPRYLCPYCRLAFCVDCDEFIHNVLHNCPGC
jgi:transcription initiation factor TFIIH subunit 2